MARGRMLNKKISMNKAMATVDREVGPYGVIVLTWLIAHLDNEGRFTGEPVLIKGSVCPWLGGATVEVIETTLEVAQRLGIINWYEVDGTKWLCFPKFDSNQIGLRKEREAKSDVPPPPDDCRSVAGATPELLRSNAGALPERSRTDAGATPSEWNGKEENGTERNGSESNSRSRSGLGEQVKRVVEHYRTTHPSRGAHLKPGHKDWQTIEARLKEGFTVEQLCQSIDGNARDPWHRERSAHSITMVFRNAGKVEDFITTATRGPPQKKPQGWVGATMDMMEDWADEDERTTDEQARVPGDIGPPARLLPAASTRGHLEGDAGEVLRGPGPVQAPRTPSNGRQSVEGVPAVLPDAGATRGAGRDVRQATRPATGPEAPD